MRLADTCTAGAGVRLGVSDTGTEGDTGTEVVASLAEVHAAVNAAIVRRGRNRRQNTRLRCGSNERVTTAERVCLAQVPDSARSSA